MGTQTEPEHRVRAGLIGLSGLGVGTLLLLWVAIVPMDAVCSAVGGSGELPPCTAADRIAAGLGWSLRIGAGYGLSAGVVLLFGRRRSRVVVPAVLVGYGVLCLVALGQVMASTGVVLSG
ncbi:hypothetical protein [Ruania albidiflava]|uniref:hypothetical protein n=1 Tax=Ruania albidiflava TaxID=366586 RepID=UPI0003B45CD3|nr:hypothetical protein [Ruania albidiflava]